MLASTRRFYGYVIALVAFVIFFLLAGSFYGLSVLIPYMAAEMDWSATEFGIAFSIIFLTVGLSSPLVGIIISRFGPRFSMILGSFMVATSLSLMSTTTSLWQLYLFAIILGSGVTAGAILPVIQIIGDWFNIRRSSVMGLVAAGGGMGGLLFAPLASNVTILVDSWRITWLILGGITLIPAVLTVLFVCSKPADLGQQPDGILLTKHGGETTNPDQPVQRVYKSSVDWKVREVTRTKAFWLITLAKTASIWAMQAVVAHQVVYLNEERHLDIELAASALGFMAGFSILGRIFGGWLGDRVEPRLVIAGLLTLQASALLVLTTIAGQLAIFFYVVSFGVGYGGMAILPAALMFNYFGSRNYSAIMGVALPVGTFLGAFSPMFAGLIKDISGTYLPAFGIMTVVVSVGVICALLAKPPVLTDAHQPTADKSQQAKRD
jgi:MFS transporter, OFA family, oxalate/formate antiporter